MKADNGNFDKINNTEVLYLVFWWKKHFFVRVIKGTTILVEM